MRAKKEQKDHGKVPERSHRIPLEVVSYARGGILYIVRKTGWPVVTFVVSLQKKIKNNTP